MPDTPVAVPVLRSACLSDPGRVRTNNEDLAVLDPGRGIFGVIDGVGGHAAGELAAAIARDVILQRLARPLGSPAERVREAIAIANNEIFRRSAAEPDLAGMTCVVTLAVIGEGRVTVGHVGDSRLYKLRPSGLRKLTRDHSPVGEREDAGELGEIEAMQHPRRHEVFRDVGSALRDKDEPDYVEVVEDALEDDAAILVCSDGLTDMIPAATIAGVVRRHAGDPAAVATALVAAANEAGGRDNVTVVYAEAPGFAEAFRAGAASDAAVTAVAAPPAAAGRATRTGRLLASRTTWFVLGSIIGVLGALLLAWRLTGDAPAVGRTLVAAPRASATVGTLAAAVQAARAGDVIRLEPGTYAESVEVPEGVALRARVAGASLFVRPSGAAGAWVAIIARGTSGGVISGIRVASTVAAPVQVAVQVGGHGRAIELMQVDGPVEAGVQLLPDTTASLQGSQFAVTGVAVALGARSQLDASGNVFVGPTRQAAAGATRPPATPGSTPPADAAISVAAGARLTLRRNVFAGLGTNPIQGGSDADWEPLRAGNVVVSMNTFSSR